MDEAGIVRFPGNLDPRAQEFRPRNHHQLTLFTPQPPPPPQIYYPYTPSPPTTYTPLSPCGVGYHPFPIRPAYVSVSVSPNTAVATTGGQEPLPPPSATPSRTLLLSSVPTDVSESTVRMELEVFGDVRAVQMERVYDGIVTVHFYDLRHAQLALTEIREQHMQQQSRLRNHFINSISGYGVVENCAAQQQQPPPLPPPARGLISGRAVWAQFMIPTSSSGVPDGLNQGTIVVFNLDSDISSSRLKEIFEAFGSVKELRETPLKRHQKFVEFYDIRDAAKALNEMNGKEIQGKYVVIEFSRPGGHGRRFFNNNSATATNSRNRIAQPRKISGRTAYNVPPRSSYLCPSMKKNRSGKSSKNSSILGVEDSMADLCVEEDDGNNSNNGGGGVDVSRRNSKKFSNNNNNSSSSSSSSNTGGVVVSRSRSVKGRLMMKNFDSRFSINEDAILESNCRDSRTTVMIKNIPNKYSLKLLLNMIDNHCIHCNEQIAAASGGDAQPFSAYDFVYLPIDFNNKCNVGYGFVNMTTPEATWRLYKAFHLQSWEVFNSKKICQVTYARVQGLEALKEHFKNSKFPSVTEEIFPVVFTPPRDGRLLTEPLPIYGHAIPPPPPPPTPTPTPTVPTTPVSTKSDDDDHDIDGPYFPGETNTTEDGGDEVDSGHWVENDDYADDDDDEEDVGCCRSRSGGDYDEKITVEQQH